MFIFLSQFHWRQQCLLNHPLQDAHRICQLLSFQRGDRIGVNFLSYQIVYEERQMPASINGCGTRYYGSREVGPDGSYVTTEWITFVYVPLFPIRSMRVLPQGKGTNAVVFHSQDYLTGRVPLSWPQVRNVYLIMGPIFAVILYFSWGNLTTWAKSEWTDAQPLRVQAAPHESPLDAANSVVACGSVMKLEAPAYIKFNIPDRITQAVKEGNFTDAELKGITSEKDLEDEAFGAYSLGYLTSNKPVDPTRSDLGKKMIATINEESGKLSGDEAATLKAYGRKLLQVLMNAFDMGRRDGRTSPCSP